MKGGPADDYREVHYSEERWRLLSLKREKAIRIMETLQRHLKLPIITHGSIARGDVKPTSDVDIVILETPKPPGILDWIFESLGLEVAKRVIVQATPGYTPKVYYYMDWREEVVVSFPLSKLKPREREFYKWGGEATLDDLKKGRRIPGVNKDLKLIVPQPWGHFEYSVIGREGLVARLLGVSIETVEERVRVLSRRREIGRTGVFIEWEIPPHMPLEEAIRLLARENKLFRRALTFS
ncbi:MAG: nucleotidyltransferase domain-containing protein [Desulfurococcales archaeon]|nr:nucleotidyltransferase domain-containing protein [Desulfurococcales archaeon]